MIEPDIDRETNKETPPLFIIVRINHLHIILVDVEIIRDF